MRRALRAKPTRALLILAACTPLAACGAASHPTSVATSAHAGQTGTGSAPSSRAQPGGAGPLSQTRARAYARSVNLTGADVPGFTVASAAEHERETTSEKQLERAMLRCVGALGSGGAVAEMRSKEFQRQGGPRQQTVQSEVTVARSASLAATELGAIRSRHARGCLGHYLQLLLQGKRFHGARIGPVSIQQGTPPAPGTSGGFGWRISAVVGARGISLPFYIDILGFVYGPAEVSLFSSGVPEPFPAAAQQRLFNLLLRRARSQHP